MKIPPDGKDIQSKSPCLLAFHWCTMNWFQPEFHCEHQKLKYGFEIRQIWTMVHLHSMQSPVWQIMHSVRSLQQASGYISDFRNVLYSGGQRPKFDFRIKSKLYRLIIKLPQDLAPTYPKACSLYPYPASSIGPWLRNDSAGQSRQDELSLKNVKLKHDSSIWHKVLQSQRLPVSRGKFLRYAYFTW